MNNSCLIVKQYQHQPFSLALFKPKKRKFFRQKNIEHSSLTKQKPKDKQNSQVNAQTLHQRQRSKTKQTLVDLFTANISFFFRLNNQKSTYHKLFSGKENVTKNHRKNNLEKTTSTKIRPQTAQNQSVKRQNSPFKFREQLFKEAKKLRRPRSCKSTVHSTNLITLHTQL